MAWRDLDLAGAVWRIGKTKNGTPQNVPLSPEAIMVLNARRERAGGSPFVFPGTGKTGHLVEPKKAWATILRTASLLRLLDALNLNEAARTEVEALLAEGLAKAEKRYHAQAAAVGIDPADFAMTDLRIHDLRRTLGRYATRVGISDRIISRLFNHLPPKKEDEDEGAKSSVRYQEPEWFELQDALQKVEHLMASSAPTFYNMLKPADWPLLPTRQEPASSEE